MKRMYKGDLDHCPFCGIMLSWVVQNDITFNNIMYFQCKNCGGEISINKNTYGSKNVFEKHNIFTVESVGGFNYSKINVRENLSVVELIERAHQAEAEIALLRKKKEELLSGIINSEGEVINTPQSFKRKKAFKRLFYTYLGLGIFAAALILAYYFLFIF